MASARARLGASRRSLIKRQKTTDAITGFLSTVASLTSLGMDKAGEAKTAWEDYETGFKKLGGDPEDIVREGGWLKKTFGMPEGEVTIGGKIYDRENITKGGSFLGGDIAAILGEDASTRYMERTAPGKAIEYDKTIGTSMGTIRENKYNPYQDLLDTYPDDFKDMSQGFLQRITQGIKQKISDIGVKSWEKSEGRRIESEKQRIMYDQDTTPKKISTTQTSTTFNLQKQLEDAISGGASDLEVNRIASQIKQKNAQNRQSFTKPANDPSYINTMDPVIINPEKDSSAGNSYTRGTPWSPGLEDEPIKGYYGEERNLLESLRENNRNRNRY